MRHPISRRSAAILREQAAEFRAMAEEAAPTEVAEALLRLADRYELLAEQREQAAGLEAEAASRVRSDVAG
jgi:hypothetical protein